jgi:hypothetical protein
VGDDAATIPERFIAQSVGGTRAADIVVAGHPVEVKRIRRPGAAAIAMKARQHSDGQTREASAAQAILILVQAFDEHLKQAQIVFDWVRGAAADPEVRDAINRLGQGGGSTTPVEGEIRHSAPEPDFGMDDLEALADSAALADADLLGFEQRLSEDAALSGLFDDSARELAVTHNLDLARAKWLIVIVVVVAYTTILVKADLSQDKIPVMLLASLLSALGLDSLTVGAALGRFLDARFPAEALPPPDTESD